MKRPGARIGVCVLSLAGLSACPSGDEPLFEQRSQPVVVDFLHQRQQLALGDIIRRAHRLDEAVAGADVVQHLLFAA